MPFIIVGSGVVALAFHSLPMVGIAAQHLATFKEFPIRQLGLSADVGKTIEGIQSQILK